MARLWNRRRLGKTFFLAGASLAACLAAATPALAQDDTTATPPGQAAGEEFMARPCNASATVWRIFRLTGFPRLDLRSRGGEIVALPQRRGT